jgi:RimJ/RimL family protein N-acetyltransferase
MVIEVTLRPVELADAEFLHVCWQDPATLRPFHSQPPTLAGMRQTIVNMPGHYREWIATVDGVPVGWVRLGEYDDAVDLTIIVAPERRGEHLATPIIRAACEKTQRPVEANVEGWNTPSKRAFISAGFYIAAGNKSRALLRFDNEAGGR